MASSNVKEAVAQSFSLAGVEPVSALSEGFLLYKAFGSDGRVELMNGYAKKSDHKDLITIARYWAEQGKVVQVTTNPHFKSAAYKQVFGALNGTIYER
ncbi:MAG: hypothetical protein LBJ57_05790, partial [Prevotellaceae bacterium]|nr:hypothetical protein [Prevotellaceae bacterium]